MKFLDIVENGWASEDNPRRKGIFIRKSGRNIEMTNGKGDFWLMAGDNEKLRVMGNLLKDTEPTEPAQAEGKIITEDMVNGNDCPNGQCS